MKILNLFCFHIFGSNFARIVSIFVWGTVLSFNGRMKRRELIPPLDARGLNFGGGGENVLGGVDTINA